MWGGRSAPPLCCGASPATRSQDCGLMREAHRLPGCRWLRPLRGGGRQAPSPRTAPFRTPGSPAPPTGPCGTILRSGCSAHTGIIRWDGGSRTTGVALGLQNRWGARASPVGSIPTCSRQHLQQQAKAAGAQRAVRRAGPSRGGLCTIFVPYANEDQRGEGGASRDTTASKRSASSCCALARMWRP